MVQLLLRHGLRQWRRAGLMLACIALALPAAWAGTRGKPASAQRELWELSLEGGRKLTWERSFRSEKDIRTNRGFWRKLMDVVAGEPDYHFLTRPFSVVTDSRGRVLVTDPGMDGVHIFDFAQHKYKFIERHSRNFPMRAPQCVAVDSQDNIYVTDSDVGVIFVFNRNGKYQRTIGAIKGGEGYFKRPTGIAVDSEAHRIYVSDTLRDQIFVLDMKGNVLKTIGKAGVAEGEFYYPTELRLWGADLIVVDALNFRVQVFDRSGNFKFAIGKIGDGAGAVFRPKAVAVDSEGHLYVVDAVFGMVQVFNREGQLLYYFGKKGTHAGQFQLPTGLFIDRHDKVYVVDSFNRRVQVFQYVGLNKAPGEGLQ